MEKAFSRPKSFKADSFLNIDVVPITFYDNKKRFSYSFFSGGPGTLRIGIHKFLKTGHLNNGDTRELNKTDYDIIFKSLIISPSNVLYTVFTVLPATDPIFVSLYQFTELVAVAS